MTNYALLSFLLIAMPGAAFAASPETASADRAECDRLINALERQSPAQAHAALQQMRIYRDGNQYTACVAAAQSDQQTESGIQVGRLADMEVFNDNGVEIGDVDRVVRDGDRRVYVLTTFRGSRWPGNKQVALPLDRLMVRSGKLVVSDLTEDELRSMPSVHQDGASYTPVPDTETARIRVATPTEAGSVPLKQ